MIFREPLYCCVSIKTVNIQTLRVFYCLLDHNNNNDAVDVAFFSVRVLFLSQNHDQIRGGSRGRVQRVRTPPPPEMTRGFLIQLVFCKKKTMWFIGVEVEQETSAPPPKKNPGSAPANRAKFERLPSAVNRFLTVFFLIWMGLLLFKTFIAFFPAFTLFFAFLLLVGFCYLIIITIIVNWYNK